MVETRPVAIAELARVVEIDVSESGSVVYSVVAGRLVLRGTAWRRSPRSADHWRSYVAEWKGGVARPSARSRKEG